MPVSLLLQTLSFLGIELQLLHASFLLSVLFFQPLLLCCCLFAVLARLQRDGLYTLTECSPRDSVRCSVISATCLRESAGVNWDYCGAGDCPLAGEPAEAAISLCHGCECASPCIPFMGDSEICVVDASCAAHAWDYCTTSGCLSLPLCPCCISLTSMQCRCGMQSGLSRLACANQSPPIPRPPRCSRLLASSSQ